MSRPELGTKRVCVGCTARFYDLTRSPPVCPKCGVAQPPEVARVRAGTRGIGPGRGAPWRNARPPVAEDPVAETEVAESEDDDEEEAEVPGIDADDAAVDADEIGLKTTAVD